eukprot:gene12859-12986_t
MDSDDEVDNITQQRPEDEHANLPALFWDSMPDNAEEHPDYIALKALAEESTPEERAENFKTQGNNKLRIGLKANNKLLLREAVGFYDKGLALTCHDAHVNLALHNNRAHVNSLLGNWRSALQDSQAAMQIDPSNLKAVFRGARAALKLGQWEECQQLLGRGFALEPAAKELLQIQQEHKDQKAAQAAAREQALAPARQLAAALSLKGYKITLPQVHVGTRKPYLGADDGAIHWPVLLMYPETGQQDVIEDWHEDDSVADHLNVMFGPDAPPLEWDDSQEYTRDRVQLCFLSHAGPTLTQEQLVQALHGEWPELSEDAGLKRHGQGASHWATVDENMTLKDVLLQPNHLVPGVPLFWVLARGTAYEGRFLSEELKRF